MLRVQVVHNASLLMLAVRNRKARLLIPKMSIPLPEATGLALEGPSLLEKRQELPLSSLEQTADFMGERIYKAS